MFKILVLQQLYNLSDNQTEYQIRDRYSFGRFLGLQPEDAVPDAKTIWRFREGLKSARVFESLFDELSSQIAAQGYIARQGQLVDASIVRRRCPDGRETSPLRAGVPAPDGVCVALVRAGRTPRELECSAQAVPTGCVRRSAMKGVARTVRRAPSARSCGGCAERIAGFARSGKCQEKPRLGSLGRPARCPGGLRARESEPSRAQDGHDVPNAGCLPQRVPCVNASRAFAPCAP